LQWKNRLLPLAESVMFSNTDKRFQVHQFITYSYGSRGGRVFRGIYAFVCFLHDISKLMQLGSSNLISKCSVMNHGNNMYFGIKRSKVQVRGTKMSPLVFRQNSILPLAAFVSDVGFCPLKCPTAKYIIYCMLPLEVNKVVQNPY